MMNATKIFSITTRCYSSSFGATHYPVLVVGGGAGGSAIANKFANKLGYGKVGVIEPNSDHYYQPLWTLVGAGIKTLDQSRSQTKDVFSSNATWIKGCVSAIDPETNTVHLEGGGVRTYNYLVVALGIELNFEAIRGFPEAWSDPRICSNYSAETVLRTFKAFQAFEGGNAIFTMPNTPIKCPGAPQKICYLFEDFMKRNGKRDSAEITYNTALPVIFSVKKYAEALDKMCGERGIRWNSRRNLVEVRPEKSEAVFENLDTNEEIVMKYSLLHITPPMRSPRPLRENSPLLVDETGFVSVNQETLQHTKYPNVFAIGDCLNVPTAKTAAAISSQSAVILKNLSAVMEKRDVAQRSYDGYSSCPLVTGYNSCILAEFVYKFEPRETFPINQAKTRYIWFLMKAYMMSPLYWQGLVKGHWNGPKMIRTLMHLGMGK